MQYKQRSMEILLSFMLCHLVYESWTLSTSDNSIINDHIEFRQLREAGYHEFELTTTTGMMEEKKIRVDAALIHRHRRSNDGVNKIEVEIKAFNELYEMALHHKKSILHPSAEIMIINGDTESKWEGQHPDCFLTGDVHSHYGTVSASFCNELSGIMATNEHELYFEVLPHHIRKRSILKEKGHTTLVSRKTRSHLYLVDLKLNNDYVSMRANYFNHDRHRRDVPSNSFTIELGVYCDETFMARYLFATPTVDRVTAMLVKYHAVAFEWGRAEALGYNITLSMKLISFFETNPSWYNASTALGTPLKTICQGTKNGLPYDHIHVHTAVGSGGLAYQDRICDNRYRCGVSADGLISYGTTAHEIGHNMGMYHDADRGCLPPDVGMMGGAQVSWSNCSARDMNSMLQTGKHNCLWEVNVPDDDIGQEELQTLSMELGLPGQLYTNDEICQTIYGSGFNYREYPHIRPTICNIFSCVDLNTIPGTTYGRMYKQSNSITGSYCADNKICFKGSCQDWSLAKLSNLEVREGGWSNWGSWITCSRTCGQGISFRKRKCDNPTPKNHATCTGSEYEANGCNMMPCVGDSPKDSQLIDQRASETCANLINNKVIDGKLYKAEGDIYSSLRWGVCEVECTPVDGYIPPEFTRYGLMEHGTPCSGSMDNADRNMYSRRPGYHWACLEGYCKRFDCANTLNNGVFDECGVCNGKNDTCLTRKGTNTDILRKWARKEWMKIPVGAYDIEMSFIWNNNQKYYIEVWTKDGTAIIASSQGYSNPARIFQTKDNPVSYGGTFWHFNYVGQIMHAKGPINKPVVAKIFNFGTTNNNTGIDYIYAAPPDIETCSGTCKNGGTWNMDMCACDCPKEFSGTFCESQCKRKLLCQNGASVNESTCECICNDKQYGSLCRCKYPYIGGNCNTCKHYTCYNGGTFNPETCRCQCSPGRGGLQCQSVCEDLSSKCVAAAAAGNCTSDNIYMEQNCMLSCNLCELPCSGTCENNGTWNENTCTCECLPGFYGVICDSKCNTSKLCHNDSPINESTCECICNDKQYGSLCDCKYPFVGENCSYCKYTTCNNGGTFNSSSCRCKCPQGFGGLKCDRNCEDLVNTCVADAAAGKCITDTIYMEQNCMSSCKLCELPCSGTCENNGTWNENTCTCECLPGFYGVICDSTCNSSNLCHNGSPINESTCECTCNDKQYGSLCDCKYPFVGENCSYCKYNTCNNGGTFNSSNCRCKCPPGFGGLTCDRNCEDLVNTCVADAAAGNCTTDNIYMEQNCMSSCNLCNLKEEETSKKEVPSTVVLVVVVALCVVLVVVIGGLTWKHRNKASKGGVCIKKRSEKYETTKHLTDLTEKMSSDV